MAKYDPLRDYLRAKTETGFALDFQQISDLVGGLPPSAFKYREWWSNGANASHVHAHAWLFAGYKVETVDLSKQVVKFRRDRNS